MIYQLVAHKMAIERNPLLVEKLVLKFCGDREMAGVVVNGKLAKPVGVGGPVEVVEMEESCWGYAFP